MSSSFPTRSNTTRSNTTGRLRRRTSTALAGLALAATLVTGCASGGSDATSSKRPVATSSTDAPAHTTERKDPAQPHQVVRIDHDLTAYAEPATDAEQKQIAAKTELGSPTSLLITGYQDGWVQVLVPGRPTGATAWLPAQGLDVRTVTTRIQVDLATRTLTLFDQGREVLSTPVAIGADDTPTPTGAFSITDKLDTQNAGGAYGRYAIGLSGRSEVLTEFAGGDGQIGIHGTNDPDSIGKNVSHGCIRVPNEVMERLSAILPLGTPVVVG